MAHKVPSTEQFEQMQSLASLAGIEIDSEAYQVILRLLKNGVQPDAIADVLAKGAKQWRRRILKKKRDKEKADTTPMVKIEPMETTSSPSSPSTNDSGLTGSGDTALYRHSIYVSLSRMKIETDQKRMKKEPNKRGRSDS